MGIFTKRWESLPTDGNLYQKMGIFTKRWESLPKDGNLYQKMESLPKDGNLYQTMGIFTKRWNLYQTMGIFTKRWESLPQLENIWERFSIPLRVWNSEIYLRNWCIFDTQTNHEIYIYTPRKLTCPQRRGHFKKKGIIFQPLIFRDMLCYSPPLERSRWPASGAMSRHWNLAANWGDS